jgi:hypothetical protein
MEARARQWTTPPHADDFERAATEMNESIVGWRRYYGAVLDESALGTMSCGQRSMSCTTGRQRIVFGATACALRAKVR